MLFALDIDTKRISIPTNHIHKNTFNRYQMKFRERIAEVCESDSPLGKVEFEVYESYFRVRRVRDKRQRRKERKEKEE